MPRALTALLAALLTSACQAAGPVAVTAPFVLGLEVHGGEPVGPVVVATRPPVSEQPPATGPSAVPGGPGGGSASAPVGLSATEPPAVEAPLLTLAWSGLGEASLPVGAAAGEWTLVADGAVPATLEVPAGGLAAVHPRPVLPPASVSGSDTWLDGTVAAAASGAPVAVYVAGRPLGAGLSLGAGGSFRVAVPLAAVADVLVVVREPGSERVALAGLTMAPGEDRVVSLDWRSPASAAVCPPLPVGMRLLGGGSFWRGGQPDSAWRAPVVTGAGASVASYGADLPVLASFVAASPDGLRGAETCGRPGAVPAFLAPPQLTRLPEAWTPGTRVRWEPVAGAGLYTLKLYDPARPDAPVWEGATRRTSVVLPEAVGYSAEPLTLRLEAWDAAGVNLYSVAGLRALRVPVAVTEAGRRAWSEWTPGGEAP